VTTELNWEEQQFLHCGVAVSCFGVIIPRHLITPQDTNFGNNVGFVFVGVSPITSVGMEASMSSTCWIREENNNRLVCISQNVTFTKHMHFVAR